MTDLLKDKTGKALVSMSLPISIGMLSTFLFQVIDTYFVGQLGPEALAALSFASTIYFLLVGLFVGLSVGISIIIGKATGEGDRGKVGKTTRMAIVLCILLSALLSAAGILFLEPLFGLLGADALVMPLIKAYTVPLLLGIPLLTTGLICGGILRASGNITKPEVLMAVAGAVNLFFDYVLIFGKWGFPELGIRGAALATVLSWVVVIIGMVVLLLQDKLLVISVKTSATLKQIIREIFQLSGPTIVTQVVGPLTLMYLTFLLARESSMAVAAFGIAGRIETLLMIGILGVSTAITPFIAQNSGAQKHDRIEEAIAFGGRASTYLGLLVALLLFLFVRPLARIFSDSPEVVNYTSDYFYIICLSYTFYGLYLITTSIFNGLQLPVNSLRISLVKSLLLTVPLTLIGSFWGIHGIFVGLALGNVLAGLYSSFEMRKQFRKVNSSLADVNVLQEYKNDFLRLFGKSDRN